MYRTIFEITPFYSFGFWVSLLFIGIGLTILTTFLVAGPRKLWPMNFKQWQILGFGVGFFTLGLAAASVSLARQFSDYRTYRSGDVEVVEGTVHVLHAEPVGSRRPSDLIEVGDRTIALSSFREGSGYKLTIAQGGELQEGRRVRLYLNGGSILRADLWEPVDASF